jgi:ATP adenylyltransferase
MERLWAGWRTNYINAGGAHGQCVFCGLLASDLPNEETNIVWRDDKVAVILNAYPYGSGHTLVMPVRHLGELEALTEDESQALWNAITKTARVVKLAYTAPGLNVGFNLGSASGAGIPDHLHAHVLPRWNADTNFMTSVANTRVLPEPLTDTWKKLRDSWDLV